MKYMSTAIRTAVNGINIANISGHKYWYHTSISAKAILTHLWHNSSLAMVSLNVICSCSEVVHSICDSLPVTVHCASTRTILALEVLDVLLQITSLSEWKRLQLTAVRLPNEISWGLLSSRKLAKWTVQVALENRPTQAVGIELYSISFGPVTLRTSDWWLETPQHLQRRR